jgi:hypothetical protein
MEKSSDIRLPGKTIGLPTRSTIQDIMMLGVVIALAA